MKRRTVWSIAIIVCGALMFMAGFGRWVDAQVSGQLVSTGNIVVNSLTPDQKLRVIVTSANHSQTMGIQFTSDYYVQQSDGLLVIASTQTTPMRMLAPNQAILLDVLPGRFDAVRVRVNSNHTDFVESGQLIKISTGEIQAVIPAAVGPQSHKLSN